MTAGLAPFLGLEDADFASFAATVPDRDPRHRPVIRARLSALTEELLTALPDEVRTRMVTPRVQPLRLDDNAGSIVWQGPKDEVNLTVELGPRDLQLNLVGWNDDQAARLEAWLRSEAARGWLHNHPESELVSYRRWARNQFTRNGVDYPIWQSQNSTELDERIPARSFTTGKLDAALAQIGDPKWNKKGFHLRRPWPKETTIALGDQVVQELAGAIGELEQLSRGINGQASIG